MDWDDLEPRVPKKAQHKNLDICSVEELEEYIVELQAEISRVEDAITQKKKVRQGAEGLFKI